MPSEFHTLLLRDLDDRLLRLEERDARRSLAEIRGVNLCSNDYLGLATDPRLRDALREAVERAERVGGTGSRLLSGEASAWGELEEEFAKFAGTEAALYFGSGYAANLGLLTSLVSKDDVVLSDALNHASLIDGIRLSGARKVIYPHLDLTMLEDSLGKAEVRGGRKFIVTESIFSMDGDVADIAGLLALAEKYGAGLIVDEAHATAVHGPGGCGLVAEARASSDVVATVHTCGKALASAGAFVCGSAILREHLINHARTFIFSTAMPPYLAAQIRAALQLSAGMDEYRAQLRKGARSFAEVLHQQGWNTGHSETQIVPAIIGGNEDALVAAEYLQREGFAVRAIRPPTVPVGGARLRFSLTATIPPAEIARLENCMHALRTKLFAHATAGHA